MILALKKGENRKLVYKLFKAWRRRAILKVKKSSVKRKFKKEIVRYYSVTGNLENLLKIKLLLLWAIFSCFAISLLKIFLLFFHVKPHATSKMMFSRSGKNRDVIISLLPDSLRVYCLNYVKLQLITSTCFTISIT